MSCQYARTSEHFTPCAHQAFQHSSWSYREPFKMTDLMEAKRTVSKLKM